MMQKGIMAPPRDKFIGDIAEAMVTVGPEKVKALHGLVQAAKQGPKVLAESPTVMQALRNAYNLVAPDAFEIPH